MSSLSAIIRPVVAAPMAGGPSSPELVSAVSAAGGLGFVAGGYRSVESLAHVLGQVRSHGTALFGVNLFVPDREIPHYTPERVAAREAAVAAYAEALAGDAERLGVVLPTTNTFDTDSYAAKIDLLCEDPVPVVSFTFGVPHAAEVDRLRNVGTRVVVTVTSLVEAEAALVEGADALCVQGPEAGGHRGTHQAAADPGTASLSQLLHEIGALGVPMIAAGGIMTADDAAAARAAGAHSVQAGTAFLLTREAGTAEPHRRALSAQDAPDTAITRAFSGRWARGLANRFLVRHAGEAPAAYPEVNQLTQPLRAAAARVGDASYLSLWAGTGYARARYDTAAEVVQQLS